jgi:hypothetical protein
MNRRVRNLAPMVLNLANTASTLRSSRCFSVGSNSGSFFVVTRYGARELHQKPDCACQPTTDAGY